jgi:hypothetical protein
MFCESLFRDGGMWIRVRHGREEGEGRDEE